MRSEDLGGEGLPRPLPGGAPLPHLEVDEVRPHDQVVEAHDRVGDRDHGLALEEQILVVTDEAAAFMMLRWYVSDLASIPTSPPIWVGVAAPEATASQMAW